MKRKFLIGLTVTALAVGSIAAATPNDSDTTGVAVAAVSIAQEDHTLSETLRQQEAAESERAALADLQRRAEAHRKEVRDLERFYAYVAWTEAVEANRRAEEARQEAARKAQEAREQAAARAAQPKASAPRTAAPSAPAARSGGGSCGGWDSLISAHFPGDERTACRVMMCESGGNPNAVNNDGVYNASGLFQVIKQWASRYEQVTGLPYYDGRFDPNANAKFAAYLVRSEGWASQFDCY